MKIALIAMSGIRVMDAELLRLGLTLPGFVERSEVIASLPSLGLLTLAGMTPPAHRIAYIEVGDLNAQYPDGGLPGEYDLVAISSYSAQMHEAYELADRFRLRGARVILGGLHASSLPEEAAAHADAVVIGEGESWWPQVLEDAEHHRLQPFYGSDRVEFDLAEAPLPAYELLEISKYNRLTVQASRGCPHRCEFCGSSSLLTSQYKQKPAERVLAEIDKIRELWPHPFIEFADDNAIVNHAYWRGLLPELARRDVKWFVETDISLAQDPDLIKAMRDAGCAQVLIGLESPARSDLYGLELRTNWKMKQWNHYRKAVQAIQERGISVNGCFVIGLDGQDDSVFERVFEFVRDTGLHEVQITMQTAFPGTPLFYRMLKEGRLLNRHDWRSCTLFDVNVKPLKMSESALREGFQQLALRLYGDEFTKQRRASFKRALRAGAERE
ncbi:B12-binding domain-containing radical SAM protein [candidate division KSB1 bacterium]|nr:B12-binding domain-containing radical SAM protein [candidate division KSB1 bacterium]